ncbi:proteoglycan 4 [Pimephales promelas]|uniref:proteoglycan 4 n=1 Tax=Pimephales promelas TaxID=90988 RepID=UPI0019555025|nr:proteoglycan 4 [Pimephales promelas]
MCSCADPDLCCSGVNNSCHRLNCFCDVACLRIGDCCPDFKPTCLTVNNSSNGTKPNNTLTLTGKCSQPTLCCSGLNYDCFRGCFCDEVCKQFNDCCPDLNSTCIFNNTQTAAPPVNSTAPPTDVLTLLTNLDVEILAEESSTEEERQAALRQVGALVESYLRQYNDIYSFEVTRIEPVSSSSSPCD